MKMLPNGKKLTELENFDETRSVLDFIQKDCYYLINFEKYMECDFIVVKKSVERCFFLLYDNRFLTEPRIKNKNIFLGIVLSSTGQLLETLTHLSAMPTLHGNNFNLHKKEEPLWKLVDLQKEEKNPLTLTESLLFFEMHNLKRKFYVGYNLDNPDYPSWWESKLSLPHIEAFTKSDYSLGFRKTKDTKTNYYLTLPKTIDVPMEIVPDEYQTNNSASVKVKMNGLNQALNLGCITLTEFIKMSNELSQTNGALWIETDNKNKTRFATYKDTIKMFQIELNDSDISSWMKLFDFIFERKKIMTEKKVFILNDLIQHLEKFSVTTNNAWKICLLQLKTCIQEMKLIMYSKEDEALHAIKTYFCYYAKLKLGKKFRGVTLNANAKNELINMKISGLTVFNFSGYMKLDTSIIDQTLPKPLIQHDIQKLWRQPKLTSEKTVLNVCKERGKLLSQKLLSAYIKMGKNFLDQFVFDIFSLPFISLSCLSFQTVWHTYTQKLGFFHVGLEKTKMFQEDVLRSYCTGGFSYSCKDKLECGKPLHNQTIFESSSFFEPQLIQQPELATTIREYDLISSYGAAASQMNCPSGFCVGYTNENTGFLIRCDKKARFNSFEFLSVYYTIWKLNMEQKLNIQTVYSNFHQYGFLQINKYTLDLVVITDTGKIKMFAFDGAWAHGCRKNCPSLKRYAGNRPREELEQESEARDVAIKFWCHQINQKMNCPDYATYEVIAGCHNSEYKISSMKHYFQQRPLLFDLLDGYFTENEISQDEALFCNDKLTFIALVEGYVPLKKNSTELKPLFLQNNQRQWNRTSSTETASKGILLTKDYLTWLIKEHNFQVTKILKIYFYKKCLILGAIYKDLVNVRALSTTSEEKKMLLKNIVNFSCGFFGLNQLKNVNKMSCRLVTQRPQRYIQHYKISEMKILQVINNISIYFVKKRKNPKPFRSTTQSALPIFICIIEWGKKRMSQVFCFFEKYLMAEKYRLLYSNVDNAVLCLSTNELDEAVKPNLKKEYLEKKVELFHKQMPGCLKEEFIFGPDTEWKFVSHLTHNYAVVTNQIDHGVHKNCALKHVSTLQAYNIGLARLNQKQTCVSQIRRTCKMANLETQVQNFFC